MDDPYFSEGYLNASAIIDRGDPQTVEYSSAWGSVRYPFILRPVESSVASGAHDIVSPYGYGGPLVRCSDESQRSILVSDFHRIFTDYCRDRNVVSEFVRFHPFEDSFVDFATYYDLILDRQTVATDLSGEDFMSREFSRSTRKRVRRNARKGISVHIGDKNSLGTFLEIYRSTMRRNDASGFYYFDDDYFANLTQQLGERIVIVEARWGDKTIGGALCLVGGRRIHVHLSGTVPEYLSYSPASSIRIELAKWAKDNGYDVIHHGGGRTNSPNDDLLAFKEKFGSLRLDFFLGRRIWNQELYSSLCEEAEVDVGSAYFPAYRSGDK